MVNICYLIGFCVDCRNQTTKGIWIAKGVGVEPFTMVMDLEGTDARERGEVLKVSFFVLGVHHLK